MVKLTETQAKILIFLENASPELRYCAYISKKLDIGRAYVHANLGSMHMKGWLHRGKGFTNKVHYSLNEAAPLEAAKERLTK